MYSKKYTPEIGRYLCLTKHNGNNSEVPYKVIDVTRDKIALQQCKYIDTMNNVIEDDEDGMIILLSWHKRYGWCWRQSRFDENPLVISNSHKCLFVRNS